jgi:hypothetical protein
MGECTGSITVRVETIDKPQSDAEAKVGKNFQHTDERIVFQPHERLKTFDVVIYDNGSFDPARWFRVRIAEIVAGDAALEAPETCRVYISDDYRFPGNIPEKRRSSSFWRILYFLHECKRARGSKFWKTMAAMLYMPFQCRCGITSAEVSDRLGIESKLSGRQAWTNLRFGRNTIFINHFAPDGRFDPDKESWPHRWD